AGGEPNALRSIETPRVHHAARRCGDIGVAAGSARAAASDAGGRCALRRLARAGGRLGRGLPPRLWGNWLTRGAQTRANMLKSMPLLQISWKNASKDF